MKKDEEAQIAQIEARLRGKYGEVLNTREIAEVLRFPTADAVTKAHQRGKLPLKLTQFPGRRGFYASAGTVAIALYKFIELEKD